MPVSLLFFVLTGAIFALQLVPATGVVMMFMAAMFWSAVTINLGFVFLAIESLARPRFRYWLALPILYFGIYFALAVISHKELADLDTRLRADSSGVSVAFSPSTQDIVVAGHRTSMFSFGIASSLVRDYDLSVAYEETSSFKTAGHAAYRMGAQPLCSLIARDKKARAAGIHAYGVIGRNAIASRGQLLADICTVAGPEDPAKEVVLVTVSNSRKAYRTFEATFDQIDIRPPKGDGVAVMTGNAAPLPWIPRPVMGCFLNASPGRWVCKAGFDRGSPRVLGVDAEFGREQATAVARVLGLAPVSLPDRHVKAITVFPEALSSSIDAVNSVSSENLDRLIADPSQQVWINDLAGLREHPEMWRPRILAVQEAMERALDGGEQTRPGARTLQQLLASLPDDDFRPVANRFLTFLHARPRLLAKPRRNSDGHPIESAMLEHMSVLGAAAVPLLAAGLAVRYGSDATGPLLALCRIGGPAAAVADQVAATLPRLHDQSNRDALVVTLAALHRMGRADLAANYSQVDNSLSEIARKIRERVTPDSPPDVCVGFSGWARL